MAAGGRNREPNNIDRISDLPKSILTLILSYLPIAQAARTSILSKRWRYLWNSIPNLILTDSMDLPQSNDYVYEIDLNRWLKVVYHILLSRRDPVERCTLAVNFVKPYTIDFDNFILCLSSKGIRELCLHNSGMTYYKVTPNIFSCNNLRKLDLNNCEISLPPSFKCFSLLKTLELNSVVVTAEQLEKFISCCPLLEVLKLYESVCASGVTIRAPNLLTLDIRMCSPIRICLKDANRLEDARFWFSLPPNKIGDSCFPPEEEEDEDGLPEDDSDEEDDEEVMENCKERNVVEISHIVELLKSLGRVRSLTLQLCGSFSEGLLCTKNPDSLPTKYHLVNLKILTMKLNLLDAFAVSVLSCLLRSCPHMEELIADVTPVSMSGRLRNSVGVDYWEKQGSSECLMNHLTTVKIYWNCVEFDYLEKQGLSECFNHLKETLVDWVDVGSDCLIRFARYLVTNAHVLKRMRISHYAQTEQIKDRLNELSLLRRASPSSVLEIEACSR